MALARGPGTEALGWRSQRAFRVAAVLTVLIGIGLRVGWPLFRQTLAVAWLLLSLCWRLERALIVDSWRSGPCAGLIGAGLGLALLLMAVAAPGCLVAAFGSW